MNQNARWNGEMKKMDPQDLQLFKFSNDAVACAVCPQLIVI
jgi:hypothetical protein